LSTASQATTTKKKKETRKTVKTPKNEYVYKSLAETNLPFHNTTAASEAAIQARNTKS
jgi:hypothetical protein